MAIATKYAMDVVDQQVQAANTNTSQDADSIFANITRQQYDDFYKDFGALESSLLARSQNDQTLVDQAKKDAPKTAQISAGAASRNASRYGLAQLPDMLKAQAGSTARAGALGTSDAVNNARVAQKDLNDNLVTKLVEIGSGVNSSALGQLGSAAADATARKNAYTQAKANSQANTYSTLGTLGAAAIAAFAF